VAVGRHDRPGRFEIGRCSIVQGHKGSVLDMDWNPFDDSMLATASEDTTIKLWGIPDEWEPTGEDGNAKSGERLSDSLTDLVGHRKKVTLLKFNPTAANVLASTSADHTVRVWDIEKGEAVSTFSDMGDLTQDLIWDVRGDSYATSCKDKTVRIMDARLGTVASSIDTPHEGLKSVKLVFLGETGKLLSVGASKQSARELKIWDLKNLEKPLLTEKIDTASGVLMPMYDCDTNVIYLSGKGDGIIRPYEFEDKAPYLHKLNDGYRSTVPTKGICMVPKRGLDVMKCESARLLKLTNNQGVIPLSFVVPRKSDAFQDDIFPDCSSCDPAHTCEEWMAGSSRPPETMCLDPAQAGSNKTKKKTFKTVAQLQKEVDEANKRIEYLEQKLTENNIAF